MKRSHEVGRGNLLALPHVLDGVHLVHRPTGGRAGQQRCVGHTGVVEEEAGPPAQQGEVGGSPNMGDTPQSTTAVSALKAWLQILRIHSPKALQPYLWNKSRVVASRGFRLDTPHPLLCLRKQARMHSTWPKPLGAETRDIVCPPQRKGFLPESPGPQHRRPQQEQVIRDSSGNGKAMS